MIDFLLANIAPIGSGLVALILIIYALVTRQWMVLRSAALSLMLSAEKLMTTAEGSEKMEQVLAEVWFRVPGWMKKVITYDKLEIKLQEWYEAAKTALYLME
jgi:TRAP-type uncharacterized transport system fused permease subunit